MFGVFKQWRMPTREDIDSIYEQDSKLDQKRMSELKHQILSLNRDIKCIHKHLMGTSKEYRDILVMRTKHSIAEQQLSQLIMKQVKDW